MDIEYTARGFAVLPEITTDYCTKWRLYESSAAKGPCAWIALDQPAPSHPGQLAESSTHAHVTLDQLKAIHEQTGAMIEFLESRWA